MWTARAFALLAAAKLPAHRAAVILRLDRTNPRFLTLCQNL
jgi:hypothetical protein